MNPSRQILLNALSANLRPIPWEPQQVTAAWHKTLASLAVEGAAAVAVKLQSAGQLRAHGAEEAAAAAGYALGLTGHARESILREAWQQTHHEVPPAEVPGYSSSWGSMLQGALQGLLQG